MRVGVVGAGITGLATVHHLRKRGIEATCFEAQDEPGGVIRSFPVGDHDSRVLEAGPQRLRLTESIEELIEDLDLRSDLFVANDDLPIYVHCDGKLREVPRSLRAFARTDLLSAWGKLRVFAEPLTASGDPNESAAALLERKFGREAYANLIGPLFGGTYGSDPAWMPARHALSGLLELEAREGSLLEPALGRIVLGDSPPPISFEEGLGTLPRALYAAHADRVHLETPVTAIRRTGANRGAGTATEGTTTERNGRRGAPTGGGDGGDRSADGFVLETPNGGQRVDRVALTVDARTAAELLDTVDVQGAQGLRELRYNPLAVVHLDSDFSGAGFGYQIRWDEEFETLGVTWNASLFDREDVYTAFLGGMKSPKILDWDDETLGGLAAREFEAVLGHSAGALSITRWQQGFPAYDGSWDALDDLELPEGVDLLTNYTARAGVSSRIGQAKGLAERLARGNKMGRVRTTAAESPASN
jgi:oxygen-dependent protoporphyrinogen oxidase